MTTDELNQAKPKQPLPPKPHKSAFPEQFHHSPDHDRRHSPMTNLPDYSTSAFRTNVGDTFDGSRRNRVSDHWRSDAYEKPEAESPTFLHKDVSTLSFEHIYT